MNPASMIGSFLVYATLAGLLGGVAMTLVMRLIARRGLKSGDMIVAVGSLLTKSRENARMVGLFLHGFSAVGFGLLYTLLLIALNLSGWPSGFFAGGFVGVLHGIVVSLALVWVVADEHPIEEFREAGPAVFLEHFAGHVAYGATVGLVVALAPV